MLWRTNKAMPRPPSTSECSTTPKASASADCSPFLAVPLTEGEWLDLIKRETSLYPQIFQSNIENEQWGLMDKNLAELSESIARVRRYLGVKLNTANENSPSTGATE
jgi:hypothetical protein